MNDRDTTQQERMDMFGTTDVEELVKACKSRGIAFTTRANRRGIVIWRCHLPADLEAVLANHEAHGKVYTGGFWINRRAA